VTSRGAEKEDDLPRGYWFGCFKGGEL